MKTPHANDKECSCPFCEEELKDKCLAPEFCAPCEVEFIVCKKCGHRHRVSLKACPKCSTLKG